MKEPPCEDCPRLRDSIEDLQTRIHDLEFLVEQGLRERDAAREIVRSVLAQNHDQLGVAALVKQWEIEP